MRCASIPPVFVRVFAVVALLIPLGGCAASGGGERGTDSVRCPPSNPDCGGGGRDTGVGGSDAGVGGDAGGSGDTDLPDLEPTPDDQDGDGIPDSEESTGDTDGDGTPDYLDTDADGDGIRDDVEGTGDTDMDGEPDYLDLDADGDGIADFIEGDGDFDGDGLPNNVDPDSDNDSIPDAIEGTFDTDGDGLLDFIDEDSDGDGILDFYEGADDEDEDGQPNFRDLDSDGDGWGDADEYGRPPGDGGPPIDRDNDRFEDFIDLDSDGDGLADNNELGCPASTSHTEADSDMDGYSDLLEVAFGSLPCDPLSDITSYVDFFFELPYRGEEQHDTLEFSTDVQNGDVAFSVDTTGSMADEVSTLRGTLSGVIIPALAARLTDVAYAVGHFDDFPCGGYGGSGDIPFALLQRITRDSVAAQNGVNRLPDHYGGDGPESGFESVYQLATGMGRTDCTTVAPFDAGVGFVAGVADGTVGGAGFREGALPIIVQITDANAHARGEGGYPYGASRDEAYAALNAIGARVIGVASSGGSGARGDLEEMANRTGATVPPCAWDAARPGSCGAGQCCTGSNGAGRGTDGAGMCPLVFDISGNGTGLDSSIVDGIEALINFSRFDITTRIRPDEEELALTGIDTTCFLSGVIPLHGVPPAGACSTEPIPTDFDMDGVLDGFADVTPGTQLFFDVGAINECVPPTDEPQVFLAYIDVVGGGTAVLDTKIVTILVPPDIKR